VVQEGQYDFGWNVEIQILPANLHQSGRATLPLAVSP